MGLVLVAVVFVPDPVGAVTVLFITYWYPNEPVPDAVQLTVALVFVMLLAARPVMPGQDDEEEVVVNEVVTHVEKVVPHLVRTCA